MASPEAVMRRRIICRPLPIATLSLWLSILALELLTSFYLCGGRLIFTLDDPYIHLAVADHILAGGYGVNASELSSPSSSIIWPYLLALTELLHLGALGPLLINIIASCAALFAVLRLLDEIDLLDQGGKLFSCAVAVLLIFVLSAVALPMTGMEHSLHVWASVVVFAGLVETTRGQAPRKMHFLALVLLPLVRFEGLAFAIGAIGGFALLGRRRFAALAGVTILCSFGAYFALMAVRGLPLLPSSVLLKSRIAGNAYEGTSVFESVFHHLLASLENPYGNRLALLGLSIAFGAWLLRAERKILIVCAAVLVAIGAHLALGEYDWFHRYEVYVMALAALALLYVAVLAKPLLNAKQWTATRIGVTVLTAWAAAPYFSAALQTPVAARNIYEQQYQMGVFVKQFYMRPVAVNDLGLVAYQNSNFVLDLWGLGSEKVRKAKLAGRYGPDQMATLVDEYHIGLVMIYDSWFPNGIPASWKRIAILHTERVTAAAGDVAFYSTPAADTGEIEKALIGFKGALPSRDRLEVIEPKRPI
jgi:hypothetical protein